MNKKETQNIEFKESWHDDHLKVVAGFCNADGGKIYIGIDDKGNYIGLKNKEKKLLEDIPNKLVQHLGVVCDVNLKHKAKVEYIEIKVSKYSVPISLNGKYYFRTGSTKQELKGKALEQFLLKKSGKTWDTMPETSASIKDIDTKAIQKFKKLATNSLRLKSISQERSTQAVLSNLNLLEGKKIKRAALLLFGKNPQNYFLGATVKIGKFGKSDDDLLFQDEISGNLFDVTELVIELLDKKYFPSLIKYQGIYRKEEWPYPYAAIREAILNAIVHRDYSGNSTLISVYDTKIIFWNDGKLHEDITIEDLKKKHPSRPNNPKLAEIFYKSGLIEAWGRGTLNIVELCKSSSGKEPIFESVSNGTQVTLFADLKNKNATERLNKRQINALSYLKEHGEINNSTYQIINKTIRKTAYRDLNEMLKVGLLIKTGDSTKETIYKLNKE